MTRKAIRQIGVILNDAGEIIGEQEPILLEILTTADGSAAGSVVVPDGVQITDGGDSFGSYVLACDNTTTSVAPEFVTNINAKAIYIGDFDIATANDDLLIAWSTVSSDEGTLATLLGLYDTELTTPAGIVRYDNCIRIKGEQDADGTWGRRFTNGPLLLAQAANDTDLIQTVAIRAWNNANVITVPLGVSYA